MKGAIAVLLVAFLSTGCGPGTSREGLPDAPIPEGLKDCRFFTVQDGALGARLRIVRCPNSSTAVTTRSGKHSYYSSTVENEQ